MSGDINFGAISEELNNKADLDLANLPDNYDYVIEMQRPTADNNYTWYRKYKSGWVEQGGLTNVNTVTLPVEMADTNYTFSRTNGNGRSATYFAELYSTITNRTTTGFTVVLESALTPVAWYVAGMAA